MRTILVCLLLLIPGIPSSARAKQIIISPQTRSDPSWKEEPSSFMGIRFGVPVTKQFQECPPDPLDLFGLTGPDRQCLVRYDPKSAGLYEWKPDTKVRVLDMRMYLVDDSVEGLSVKIVRYDWPRLRDSLLLKYGLPHSRETTYRTKGGVKVPGQVLTWRGPNVTMTASEFGDKFDEGSVTLQTKVCREYLDRESKENSKENKDKS
jgi:hypothetical protein